MAPKIHFHTSHRPRAQSAYHELIKQYKDHDLDDADVIVVLGGDGSMLRALHQYAKKGKPLFGMNLGTLGFLLNSYAIEDLNERLEKAQGFDIHPLRMTVRDKNGQIHKEEAYNEVSLLRETHTTAKIRLTIDGHTRLNEIICDGILLATAVGSTAYNSSAGGPIVPLNANILPLTPISAFRPRRWPGALIPQDSEIVFDVLEAQDRPVSATADSKEVRDAVQVTVRESRSITCTLLFDPHDHLSERIFAEQFAL